MITREQVADLQPGDVVELTFLHEYDATTITARGTFPAVVDWFENHEGGKYTLTVVSRAPRPLYVNHPRTEPVPGDVIDMEGIGTFLFTTTKRYAGIRPDGRDTQWVSLPGWCPDTGPMLTKRPLRLLVDGETGQVVP